MKSDKKIFLLIEAILAAIILIVAAIMIWEKSDEENPKISVIVQDSDNSRWEAFRYGLKMAALDENVEVFVVTTGKTMTVEEEQALMESEMDNGAEGLIVEPVSGEGAEEMLKKMNRKIPVMQVESAVGEDTGIPVTKPEHTQMGEMLAEELMQDYGGSLMGKTIGMVTQDSGNASEEIRNSAAAVIEQAGGEIRWFVSGYQGSDEKMSLPSYPKVDVILALDNACLVEAGEAASEKKLHGAAVYGIGNSTEAFYCLDTGAVECLVVPDEFSIGYQSLSNMAKSLHRSKKQAEDCLVTSQVVRGDTLFLPENQSLLFGLTQ